ncbi:MAG: Hsp20/alpha crystallin family protein [Planctomycetota bacterium]|jgi:HSP20 family protein
MSHQLRRWNPFREIEDFLDRYRSDLSAGRPSGSKEAMTTADWRPLVDIREDEQGYLIEAELPGLKREQVKVSVQDEVLTVSGQREAETVQDEDRVHRIERTYGSFERRFALPEEVDPVGIAAKFEDGILKLRLPRREVVTPKAIDVKVD